MLIRREDKAIIYYIALLGAVLSVFLVNSLLGKFRENTDCQIVHDNESIRQVGAIDKLKQASALSGQMDVIENVTKQLAAVDAQEKSPSAPISFCASLSGWQVLVLSIAAGTAGYGVFWAVMWSGVMALYALIRGTYRLIGRLCPNCAAVKKSTSIQNGMVTDKRNPDRILPLVIKLTVLLTVTLALLVVVVWQFTFIRL